MVYKGNIVHPMSTEMVAVKTLKGSSYFNKNDSGVYSLFGFLVFVYNRFL